MANNTWIDGASGDWFVAKNWSTGQSPQNITYAPPYIAGTAKSPVTVAYDQADGTNYSNGVEVGAYGTLNVTAQGSGTVLNVNGVTVDANGTLNILTASPVTLGSSTATINGTLNITGNRSVTLGSGIKGSGTINLDAATVGSAGTPSMLSDTLSTTLSNGASLYLNGNNGGKSITFGPEGAANQLCLSDYNTTLTTPIYGFNKSSIITVVAGSTAPVSAAFTQINATTYTLTVKFDDYGNGITLQTVTFAPGYKPGSPTIQKNADGSWSVANAAVCFLAGTLILTDAGPVAVEDLAIGDLVMTQTPEGRTPRPIIWVGRQTARVNLAAPDADAGYPVRVLKNAVADGVPSRDLLVTGEHCLHIDAGLVPARMLVNGSSIFYDRTITQYDYYHIETERHAIIFAEDMPTETYLDTGNRHAFRQDGSIARLVPAATQSWAEHAAAPLTVARAAVEPIHARLAARAATLGLTAIGQMGLTADPDLRLVTDDGAILRPIRIRDGQAVFALPERCTAVRIVSRSARPDDVIGPFVDDRRMLGVLLTALTLWDSDQTSPIDLASIRERGWHDVDGGYRWTDGDATLALPRRAPHGNALLGMKIVSAGPYRVEVPAAMRCAA